VLAGVMVLPRADHLREVYIVQLGTVGVWDSRLCLGTRGRSDAHVLTAGKCKERSSVHGGHCLRFLKRICCLQEQRRCHSKFLCLVLKFTTLSPRPAGEVKQQVDKGWYQCLRATSS
jgi:hypothetical protein